VEIFDADGVFISMFGKHGDGPGTFARPKGIAVDSDGHIWVCDAMEDRLQVFNRDGQLLTYIGTGHGDLPGQFKALVGVAIDKKNRVFTTEQYPGRMQMFRYVTDAEAAAEKAKHDEELQKAADQRQKAGAASKPADAAPQKPPAAPATTPASTPVDTTQPKTQGR
jgi:secreted PhoX family phosphatase